MSLLFSISSRYIPSVVMPPNCSTSAVVLLADGNSILCSNLKKIFGVDQPSEFSSQEALAELNERESDSMFRLLKQHISILQDSLYEALRLAENPDPTRLCYCLNKIQSAFLTDYNRALQIYDIDFLRAKDISNDNEVYLSDISNLIDEMSWRFKLVNQKAALYDYFLDPYDPTSLSYQFSRYNYSFSLAEKRILLSRVEQYISELSFYIDDISDCPFSIETDFYKLFSIADYYCQSIIHLGKLSYKYRFKIPNNNWKKIKFKESYLQLKIIFLHIKDEFLEKY